MGAVATGGVRVLNDEIVRGLGISEHEIDAVVARELRELSRHDRLYRSDRPPSDVAGRTVILVDDFYDEAGHSLTELDVGAAAQRRDRACTNPSPSAAARLCAPPRLCEIFAAQANRFLLTSAASEHLATRP